MSPLRQKFEDGASMQAPIEGIGRSPAFDRAMYDACGLREVHRKEVQVLDAMACRGKNGFRLAALHDEAREHDERLPKLAITFIDSNERIVGSLREVPEVVKNSYDVQVADVRYPLPFINKFDVVTCRYGISRLAAGERVVVLSNLRGVLVPGGRLVLGQITAETPLAQDGIERIQREIDLARGRNTELYGECSIPRRNESVSELQLHELRFDNIEVKFNGTKRLSSDDLKGKFQKGLDEPPILQRIAHLLRVLGETNPRFVEEMDLKFFGKSWTINFPVVVVARKSP